MRPYAASRSRALHTTPCAPEMKVKSLAKDLRRLLVRGPDAAADGPGPKKDGLDGSSSLGPGVYGLGCYGRPRVLGERCHAIVFTLITILSSDGRPSRGSSRAE